MNEYTERFDQNEIVIDISRDIVLLPDYLKLLNLPKIGGVTLTGDKTAAELALLSALAQAYETLSVSDVTDEHYVPVIGEGESKKVLLSALRGTKTTTASEIPADMEIGDYIFLKKEGEHGD